MFIKEIVNEFNDLEEKVSDYGTKRLSLLTQYYDIQKSFIQELKESIDKSKRLMNADPVVRIKHNTKYQNILKKMAIFFKKVDASYKNEEIKEKEGKVFARAYGTASIGQIKSATKLLSEIEDTINVYKQYLKLKNDIDHQRKTLLRRKLYINTLIEEAKNTKPVDEDYERKHESVIQDLKKIQDLRKEYIQNISNKSIIQYIEMLKNKDLIKSGFPNTNPTNLIKFLQSNPELLSEEPNKLISYNFWTDGKLKHTIPEIKEFRKIMQEYIHWLETIDNLESSEFMRVKNYKDANILLPLFKGTKAGDVLLNLVELKDFWKEPVKNTKMIDINQLKEELLDVEENLKLLGNH